MRIKNVILISIFISLILLTNLIVFSNVKAVNENNIDENLINLIPMNIQENDEIILDKIEVKNLNENQYEVHILGFNQNLSQEYKWILNFKEDGYSIDFSTKIIKKKSNEDVLPLSPPTSGDLIGLIEPPTYPRDLVGSRSEGTVYLMVYVSAGGNVEKTEIIKSSGYDSMDRVAQLTLEHGLEFKEYKFSYRIPIKVRYYIDKSFNSQVEVDINEVEFLD
jgi:protein TonB